MKPTIIAFFNNKGGVGKTSLVYHLAWMYADLDYQVVAADLDPQANLTAAFLDERSLEHLWPDSGTPRTVFGSIEPLLRGVGDVDRPFTKRINDKITLVPGDLALSGFEDELSQTWPLCLDGRERAFRVISAFWRVMIEAASVSNAGLVLVDVGPNLGSINRAALVASDQVVIPLSPDLFSLQGLKNLGPTLRRWRHEWKERVPRNPDPVRLTLPGGDMAPIGYVILQHGVRLDRPVVAYEKWIRRIPVVYREAVLGTPAPEGISMDSDEQRLALLKHYHSLVPMAQEARKPIFQLRPADGAIGAHQQAVERAYSDFEFLAQRILEHLPSEPQVAL